MGRNCVDLTGKTFYNLTVLYKAGNNKSGNVTWLCRCICATEKIFSQDHLTRKNKSIKSCGCKRVKRGKDHSQFSGFEEISGRWWHSRVTRQRNVGNREPKLVTISMEYAWNLFLAQNRKCALTGTPLRIGTSLSCNASIDRIDNSKGYIEGNIQWVDKHINFMKGTYSQNFFIEMCRKVAIVTR